MNGDGDLADLIAVLNNTQWPGAVVLAAAVIGAALVIREFIRRVF